MSVYWLRAHRNLCEHSVLTVRGRVYCDGMFPNEIDFRNIECLVDGELISVEDVNIRLKSLYLVEDVFSVLKQEWDTWWFDVMEDGKYSDVWEEE